MPAEVQFKDLNTLKYNELQKLAKQHGIKAKKKTGCLIAALQKVLNKNEGSQEADANKTPQALIAKSGELPTPPSDSENDLMSAEPPFSDSDLMCFDSTPEQDSITQSWKTSAESETHPENRRTRSSSRNRTPKAKEAEAQKTDGKTFSVERTKIKARTGRGNAKAKTQKAAKRRSTNVEEDIVQPKKVKRSKSTTNQTQSETVNDELKNEIMAEIRKKIAESDKKNPSKQSGGDTFTSKIPRFAASGVTIGTSKPITPGNKDWNKVHNKRFEHLESIDDYERRKKERADKLLGSNQKNVGSLSRLARPSRKAGPKIVKPVIRKGRPVPTFASPAGAPRSTTKTPRSIMKSAKTQNSALQKKTQNATDTSVFKPTVTSTKNINLNFAQKSAKVATPKRVTIVSDQGDKKQTYVKTPGTGIRNRSVLTPGEKRKSTATPKVLNVSLNNTSTPGGTKKPVFDLKQSLKKPLTWVPHKGPLRAFSDTSKKPSFQDRIENIKKPNVGDRNKRRQKLAAEKKQAKDKRMLHRRGIK